MPGRPGYVETARLRGGFGERNPPIVKRQLSLTPARAKRKESLRIR